MSKKPILTNFVSLRFLDIKMATIPVTMLCEFQRNIHWCQCRTFIVFHSNNRLKAAVSMQTPDGQDLLHEGFDCA